MIPFLLDRLSVKVREWDRALIEAIVSECGGRIVGQANETRWVFVEIDHAAASEVIPRYERHPGVEWVEPAIQAEAAEIVAYHAATDDALLDGQQALKRMRVTHAWALAGRGAADFPVGVVDTGIHQQASTWPEFSGKSITGLGESAPWDNPALPHGTCVSATILASAGKGAGSVGVVPLCPLISYNIYPAAGFPSDQTFANGLLAVIASGATVVNSSQGIMAGTPPSTWINTPGVVRDALVYARDHDVLCCFAAMNEGSRLDETDADWSPALNAPTWRYPAAGAHPLGHLSVGATSYEDPDKPARYSNHGKTVSIAAPGHVNWAPVHITMTTPGGATVPTGWVSPFGDSQRVDASHVLFNYLGFNGTSCASPLVAGVCAAVRIANRSLSALQARDVVLSTVDRAQSDLFYEWFTRPGVGIANDGRAVAKALSLGSAGSVVPAVQFFGPGAEETVAAGVSTTHLRGPVEVEVDAFSTDAITRLQLLLVAGDGSTETLYDGADPRTTWTGMVPLAAARLVGKTLRVIVSTATTTASNDYSDVVGYATSSNPPRTTLLTPAGKAGAIEFAVDGANPPFTTEASWDGGAWTTCSSPLTARTGTLRLRSTDAIGNREGG